MMALLLYKKILDFPGGAVDKNPPANAGDMGLKTPHVAEN